MPDPEEDLVGGDKAGDGLAPTTSEYVQGRTKRTITAASALNDLRSSLEAVAARVRGQKPKDDGYEPRTRSRAGKGVPEDLSAELADGTRIDLIQLVQELALIVRDIAEAPSALEPGDKKAARKAASGGGSQPADAADPAMLPVESRELGQWRSDATFGGLGVGDGGPPPAHVSATHGPTDNAPHSPPALIGPGREAYQNATFGGTSGGTYGGTSGGAMQEVAPSPLGAVGQGITQSEFPTPEMRILGPVGAPAVSSLGRFTNGGAAQAVRGGVAPLEHAGIQPQGAPPAPVLANIEPDAGDFRVIHVPEP